MANFELEDQYDGMICGLDEVGRGPLAGPVVAACVVIPNEMRHFDFIEHIKDSKKLSLTKREALYDQITEHFPYAIAALSPQEIDELNILQASLEAMKRAHDQISGITHSLVDGNKAPNLSSITETVIKGDSKSKTIAAASIIAKVHRDRIMNALALEYPQYGWERNAAYPTKEHREALLTHGVTPHHRRSFAPVRKILESEQALNIKKPA